MKRTDLPTKLERLLAGSRYATVASCTPDGQPWNTPVAASFDDNLNMFWVSLADSQHSRNIAARPDISVVIYNSQAPEGEGLGLYMQMEVKVINDPAALQAGLQIYDASYFQHQDCLEPFLKACPQRLYKAVPKAVWHNSSKEYGGHRIDGRTKLRGLQV